MKRPRTLLGVWAHPDDEAYLSAGLMAEARRNGERVVLVTATLGDHGTSNPRRYPPACLRRIRHHELRKSLAALDVDEIRVIGFEDGTCDQHDGTATIADHIEDVGPDRIVTFGPDGMTGHPDHRAVSRWTTEAWVAVRPQAALWYATKTPEFHSEFAEINEAIGLWGDQPEPPSTPEDQCERLALDGALLAQKLTALRAHGSQSRPLVRLMGAEVYRAWVRTEWFRAVEPGQRPGPEGKIAGSLPSGW
jgi:LmbE family N-acetylglucosaminyl deacetylase